MVVVLVKRGNLTIGANTSYFKEQVSLLSFSWHHGQTKEDIFLFTNNPYFLKRGFGLLTRNTQLCTVSTKPGPSRYLLFIKSSLIFLLYLQGSSVEAAAAKSAHFVLDN